MRKADRTRRAALLLSAALGSCAPPHRPAAPAVTAPEAAASRCQVGPNDGPPVDWRQTDRGIGGTGGPAAAQQADRGIGGTGGPAATQQADRGIGGTGIIGVVTGFASVCLAGHEAALDASVPVEVDGARADAEALRVGQVAAIEAEGAGARVQARRIAIRHEVSGPVEAVRPDGMLTVAGQVVAITAGTLGERSPGRGAWVDVSGLRRPDGTIEATRIDARPPGSVMVHGRLEREGGQWRIGTLTVEAAANPLLATGLPVAAVGGYADGQLRGAVVTPDTLAEDPAAYFGPGVGALVIEAYAPVLQGRVWLGSELAAAAPGFAGGGAQRRVYDVALRAGPMPIVTSVETPGPVAGGVPGRAAPAGAGPGARSGFEAAPMPNRGIGGGGGGGGGGAARGFGRAGGAGPGTSGSGPGRTGASPGQGFGPGGGGGPGRDR